MLLITGKWSVWEYVMYRRKKRDAMVDDEWILVNRCEEDYIRLSTLF